MKSPTWISVTLEDVSVRFECCLINEMEKRSALPNVMCWSIFIKHDTESHAGILLDWTTANKTNRSGEIPSGNLGMWEAKRGRGGGRKKKSLSHTTWCLSMTQWAFLRGTALVWRNFIDAAQQLRLNRDKSSWRGERKCLCIHKKNTSLWYIVFCWECVQFKEV